MDNEHESWQQGRFIEYFKYRERMSGADRESFQLREERMVRPSPEGDIICEARTDKHAQWIADRLNVAAKLEKSRLTCEARSNCKEEVTHGYCERHSSEMNKRLDEIQERLIKLGY